MHTVCFAPNQQTDVVTCVRNEFNGEFPRHLKPYIDAIKRMWPELNDRRAVVNLAFEVFVDVAADEGFVITQEMLRGLARGASELSGLSAK